MTDDKSAPAEAEAIARHLVYNYGNQGLIDAITRAIADAERRGWRGRRDCGGLIEREDLGYG